MSPVKFSNTVFPVWNFLRSLKLIQNNFRSVVAIKITSVKQDFSAVNWEVESDEILQVYYTEIILNTATIRGKFDWN